MKRVLIIGYFWPYHPGGSKRVIGLAKYLSKFGWEPIVLTASLQERSDPQFRIIETPYYNVIGSLKKRLHLDPNRGVQEQIGIPSKIRDRENSITTKISKFFEGIITYPDVEKGWKSYAIQSAKSFLNTKKVDAIISIWPITAHLITKDLKDKYKIPWIADFPDLWSDTYAYSYGSIRKYFDRRLEKRTLKLADVLITSSLPLTEVLKKLHKGKNIHTITIGFDLDKINEPPAILTKKFTVTYTGIFYGKERNPKKFFTALSMLISKGLVNPNDIEIRFYGPREEWIENEIREYKLSNCVKQYGIISWEKCVERQQESQLLLHLNWENKKEKGAYSGKITEYLAARRPIFSVGGWGNDVIEELLCETEAGAYCSKIEEIENSFLQYYSEYKQKRKINYHGNIKKIDKYNYKEMAKKFANILDSIT